MGWYTSSTVGFSFADVPPTTFILTSQNMAVSTSHRGKCQCFKLSPFFTPWDLLLIFSEVFFLILLQDQVQVHKRRGREIRNDLYMYIYIYISTLIPSSPPPRASCKFHASTMHPDPRRQIRIWWSWSCQSYPRGGSEKIIPPTWPSNL